MRIRNRIERWLWTLSVLIFFVPHSFAQLPQYLAALSELRTARDYIQFDRRDRFGAERHHAVDQINKAIGEIKHAAWDDGKNTSFAPPAAGVTDPSAPLHEAKHHLDIARDQVTQGMDAPENHGIRERASAHIQEAQNILYGVLQNRGR